ncbi:hypothetical protein [Magnetospirillum fulvum]|uniref:Uncharacterized protein n=1 Tax=Magnetospirillum fulvum MGU-K5 TaxID=1316936 RepID=S9SFH0_MAGFU|nr:hypothetical protein [Magnetospirillum fulvum]EPY03484.1 hypothetical protein K678_00195 [Magnetospirillum fulvum MGU-K5]
MARVPTYTQPTVETRPLGAPQLSASVPAGTFDTGGSALVDGGQKLAAMGDQLAAHAVRMAEDDAKTSAMAALTAFQTSKRNVLFNDDTAFFRQSGQAAYAGYQKLPAALEEERVRMGSNLSAAARKLYDQASIRDLSGDLDTAARHAASEREKWRDGVSASLANSSLDEAALYWNDPGKRDAALTAARNAVLDRSAEKGIPFDDPRLQLQLRDIDSKWTTSVVQRMAEADPMAAKKFFDDNKGRLTAEQFAPVAALIDQKTKLYRVDQEVARVKALIIPAITSGPTDIATAIHQQESGGKTGDYQIQPGTWAQYAKPGESPDNPDHQKAVFDRIVSDLNAKAGGDPARIAVGYFSGPGNIAPPGSQTPWVRDAADANGKTTSAYVKDVLGRVSGNGHPSRADTFERQRDAIMGNADLKPDDRQAALTRIEHDHAQENAILAQKEKEARRQVQDMVLTKKIDPMSVPPDLQTMAGPEFMTHMQAAYGRGGVVPFNPQVENQLHELALKDPEKFVQTDLSPLYATHKTDRVEYWQGQQRQMATAEGKAALRQPSYALGDKVVKELLKATGSDNEENLAVANQRMRTWLDSWHEENKKAPPSDEVYRFGKSMLLQDDSSFFGQRRIDAMRQNKEADFILKIDRNTLPSVAEASGIPETDILPVSRFLKQKGMPVTLENLIMVHRAGTRRPTQSAGGGGNG